ncbi:uncharacterized protein ACIQIH_005851 [Cyanocitta cristata]
MDTKRGEPPHPRCGTRVSGSPSWLPASISSPRSHRLPPGRHPLIAPRSRLLISRKRAELGPPLPPPSGVSFLPPPLFITQPSGGGATPASSAPFPPERKQPAGAQRGSTAPVLGGRRAHGARGAVPALPGRAEAAGTAGRGREGPGGAGRSAGPAPPRSPPARRHAHRPRRQPIAGRPRPSRQGPPGAGAPRPIRGHGARTAPCVFASGVSIGWTAREGGVPCGGGEEGAHAPEQPETAAALIGGGHGDVTLRAVLFKAGPVSASRPPRAPPGAAPGR